MLLCILCIMLVDGVRQKSDKHEPLLLMDQELDVVIIFVVMNR